MVYVERITSVLGDVSHPRESVVATLFNNLEISHLNTRNGIVWNFKLDSNGRLLARIIYKAR
jgi:hypothetical protein